MPVDIRPIQLRRGKEADYKPNKMKAGELAVFTDTRKLNIAFAPGVSKEVALTEQVEALSNSVDTRFATATQNISASEQDIVELQNGERQINALLNGKVDEIILSEDRKYLTFRANGSTIAEVGPFAGEGGGGGGGGEQTVTVMSMTNLSGWLAKTISKGTEVSVSCDWSSTLGDIPTGNGALKVYVDGTVRQTRSVEQGQFTVNLTNYLSVGVRSIRINVSDVYGNSRDIRYTVTVEDYSITSTFDANTPVSGAFIFPYVPYGTVSKTVHFKLDGVELATDVVETSGRQQNKNIPAQSHGAHTLEVWYVVDMDGESVESNHLWYEFIAVASGTSTAVISSQYNATTAEQYQTINIPYQVYSPDSITSQIELVIDGNVIQTITVDRSEQVWSYRPLDYGAKVFKIRCGSVEKTFSITVTQSEADIGAVTENLALHLTAQGRSNGEANPGVWSYGNISATMTGFSFVKDGWVLDDDGVSVLRVAGGARVTIPYNMFAGDPRTNGMTVEVEYATRSVADYNATIMSCMSGDRGFRITPQEAELKSEQTTINMQYKDGEHIRVAFTVGKRSEHRLLTSYIDGMPARVTQYPTDDDFAQVSPVGITIGSDDCTIDIYCIRVYTTDLDVHQIRGNWIADTQDAQLMLARFERNQIYDSYGNIIFDNLPNDLPYMVIECEELPQYKGDKKTCSIRYVDPSNAARSFTASGVQINVQGTSSAPYAVKNLDIQAKQGFEIGGRHADKYALRGEEESIPTARFVAKADVASSESANNTQLTRYYNDICPYKSAEMITDSRVRWGIDGVQMVLFWTNTTTGDTSFVGKFNFNFPKRFPEGYGYSGNMESWEFQNNTSDLLLFKTDVFDMTPYIDDETGEERPQWRKDYEARFPEDTWQNIAKLQEFQSWVVSTDRSKATGDALDSSVTYDGTTYTTDTAAYRLAKFKAELGNRAEVTSLIFYYVFTEFFLMVDSRAKNLFLGFKGSPVTISGSVIDRKICAEPYDMDTAIGIKC